MKIKNLLLVLPFLITSCMSVPEETVMISQTLGNDLEVLHHSHRQLVQLHFKRIKEDINDFIESTYAPFVIHYVLSAELGAHQAGEESLYSLLETAGKDGGKKETEDALKAMLDFHTAARDQIESKRNELLDPVLKQETELLVAVDQSYQNTLYANSAITGHLRSMRNVKTAQQETLTKIGLQNADQFVTTNLVKISNGISEAVKRGKKLDIQSNNAMEKIENVVDQIKKATNPKN